MKYHFIHALVLTPFESSLTSRQWDEVVAQDYPIHALYCKDLNRIIFQSDNQKCNCLEKISEICSLLENLEIELFLEQQIIILENDENEYSAQDVLKHFNH